VSEGSARHGPMDALRGLVIVLMALDHVRGFFTPAGADPTDLDQTTLGFFAMRWVTHLCAPAFVLLMGAGAALRHARRPEGTTRFLLTRGLWLILLELTWISFAWSWDPGFRYLGVLWALGASMVLLVPFTRLPAWTGVAVGVLGTVAIAVVGAERGDPGVGFWLQPASLELAGMNVRASYAAVPWFLAAAVGWGSAHWLVTARRQHIGLVGAGAAALGLGLRLLGVGNPRPWADTPDAFATALDVLHLDKYPPSLDFLLVFLGLGLVLLAGPLPGDGPVRRWLRMLGRVPMFFYLLHLPFAHAAGNALAWVWFGQARIPPSEPVRLWLVLLAWAGVVAALTPLCAAWGRLKRRRRDLWWLAYL
jgi:uncharacterized membrane protein